jgi:hypothetical protein
MPTPLFNEERHEYTLGGKKLPSVTTILNEFVYVDHGPYPFYISRLTGNIIYASVMEAASDYGTAVHKAMEYSLTLGPDGFEYPQEIKSAVVNLDLWKKEHNPEIIYVEKRMASSVYGCAGTLDIFCKVGRHLCLVDVKTGPGMMTGPQQAAYEKLLREETGEKKPIKRFKLFLPKTGKRYQLIPLTNTDDWTYFQARLFSHKWETAA